MKKIVTAVICLFTAISMNSQTVVKIGDIELALQSPISISKDKAAKPDHDKHFEYKGFRKTFDETYVGFGLALNTREENYMPVFYGNSYNLEFGKKYLYRPVKHYAIGTFLQYTNNSYKLTPEAVDNDFFPSVGGEPYKQYFRTSNIGTGIFNRIYISASNRPIYIDFGGYFDYAFSKRYKVKTVIDGEKVKYKFRDGSKFNPFAAGFYGGIGMKDSFLYLKYRMTNFFNEDFGMQELPRWNVGIQFKL